MELVEVRDLDGPSLFARVPVIKLEVCIDAGDSDVSETLERLTDAIGRLHSMAGLDAPEVGRRDIDTAGHYALFYPWEWRETGLEIAEAAFRSVVARAEDEDLTGKLARLLKRDREKDDRPEWVRDSERRIPTVGITGTNGKTTTTRLLAHICMTAGKHVGWSSSSGVYIDGEKVIEGDYTGPSGARRVLNDPDVEIAVLETARGGILLRGVAYESNDVSVFLNLTADHLNLQGVETLETLAEVKSVVIQATRPDGLVVLNADDPIVLEQRARVLPEVLLFSQNPDSAAFRDHIDAGGKAVLRRGDSILAVLDGTEREIARLQDVPMTFNGAARHMVENALAACGAAIGLGFSIDQIASGLKTFRSDVQSNVGRLNVFKLDGRLVIVDYAHNESGLTELLRFGRALMSGDGKLSAIIGTAGDREDEVLTGLGRIAGTSADRIFIKENPGYLRGRDLGVSNEIMRSGVAGVGALDRLAGIYPGEYVALLAALDESSPGDAIAIMCVEDQMTILRGLRDRGAQEW
jgi:cyanophycin synthetase